MMVPELTNSPGPLGAGSARTHLIGWGMSCEPCFFPAFAKAEKAGKEQAPASSRCAYAEGCVLT